MIRKILALTALAVLAQLMGACAPQPGKVYPPRQVAAFDDYNIVYSFEATDSLTGKLVHPAIQVTAYVPGWANDSRVEPTSPITYTINGSERPAAEQYSRVTGTVVSGGAASTVLKCTWAAQTVAGPRTSAHSRGGEDEGTGTSATATCEYKA